EAEETARPTELVWGLGVLAWQLNDARGGIDYAYPLLTHALEIALDDHTMAIEIRPRTVPTRVELEALIHCGVRGAAEVERTLREQLQRPERPQVSPFDPSSYGDLARLVATNLDNEGRFVEVLARQEAVPSPGPHLVVTDAWVVLSRPRPRSVLIEDLVRLEQAVVEAQVLPPGPAAIVTPPSSTQASGERILFRGVSSRGGGANYQELYFPLPYNDEQVRVIERLERSAGVTVQGPPGTGKTHTIANIICHYLATGRRVLVTSKGEPALAVLRDKLPEEVRPLAVAMLTNDRESLRQCQGAIEAIQHRVSQLNERTVERDIATHHQAIERAHAELIRIDRRVDEIALAQLSEIELDGERVRPQKAAQLVVEGEEEFGWFDDAVGPSPEHAPPLSVEEAQALREARRRVGEDLKYLSADLPNPIELPSAEAIGELHEAVCRLKALRRRERSGALLALKRGASEVLVAARALLELIERALGRVAALEHTASPWGLELRRKLREEAWNAEREALEALLRALEPFREARARFLQNPIEVPEEALECEKTREAVRRAAERGKPFGLLALNAGRAKALVPAIRVAGLPPTTPEAWQHVERFLQLHVELRTFSVRWNHCAAALGIPSIAATPQALRGVEELGAAVQTAYTLAVEIDPQLSAHAVQVFEQPPLERVLGHAADLEAIRECLQDHLNAAELERSAAAIAVLQEKLAGRTGEITEKLREFVAGLGREGVRSEDIARQYAGLIGELRRVVGLSGDLLTLRDLTSRIEAAGAPRFAERLRSLPVGGAGDDPALPARWREAWRWARLRGFLESIEGAAELRQLAAERTQWERTLERLYREVVAQATWLAIKRAASPHVMQALSQYATAVRRIGKGTGPNAVRYRRDAQEAMVAAAEAIPCWIMSHYKVSESMPAQLGRFDLVIVDEASQSDLTAIPAILRAKRVLVVGDDKQVSPTGGFIDSQRIQELLDRFLTDQPYRTELTPEKSLYDLAGRVYAAEQIMLREHFRCVPAIIAYSNQLFYSGAIAPLRIPKASERLDPPLIDIYVPEGVRDRRDRNVPEAEAIAAEIEAILADPRFDGRSVGVISLLGLEQAKCIDEVVRVRCDGAELHRRRFECGDASTFQGSERDVMFLSLVVDRSNCHALSGTLYDQRFNVAASRARDRMYLVRSVELGELSEKDLRR
ncbi:MAG TPA: ATP-binding protein, partial [Solirubrobacteraceae bacterium]|nr:ATP-binding protein [Solirubrobacteraceae bacterium]